MDQRIDAPSDPTGVYATPDLNPMSVDHLNEEAIRAGSDHALVVAELARA